MLLPVPDILTSEQLAKARELLSQADWVDGRVTARPSVGAVKRQHQLPENHPVARQLGEIILSALERNALFISAALPARIFPPLFNRYEGGQSFGTHVDNAIRQVTGTSIEFARIFRRRYFFPSRRNMTAGSSSSKIPMVYTP